MYYNYQFVAQYLTFKVVLAVMYSYIILLILCSYYAPNLFLFFVITMSMDVLAAIVNATYVRLLIVL